MADVSLKTKNLNPKDTKILDTIPGATICEETLKGRKKSNKKKKLREPSIFQNEVLERDSEYPLKKAKRKKNKEKKDEVEKSLGSEKGTSAAKSDGEKREKKKRKREVKEEIIDTTDTPKESKRERKWKPDTLDSRDEERSFMNEFSRNTTATSSEVKQFLETHNITIHTPLNTQPTVPVLSFAQLDIPSGLHSSFVTFEEPTPIQACTWPPALQGLDVVGIAETGSGKTLAFAIPALVRLINLTPSKTKKTSTVSVLVLAPTRELAVQTHDTFRDLGAPYGIASVAVFGGVSKEPQIQMLKNFNKVKGNLTTRIVVGTPGRILDLMQENVCDLSSVEYLVLDEADRMLDRGFENDIRSIISQTKPSVQRQTLMFSATWPEAVRRLASTFQKDPVRVTVGSEDLSANGRIEQCVEVLDNSRDKDARLLSVLCSQDHKKRGMTSTDSRILVFALYKKEASRVESMLRRRGYAVGALHGDMSQNSRMETLGNFKNGTIGLMVATDVAARGLDIPNVGMVINYTFPLTVEDYIHRIGRTGRGGRSGRSITFFTGENHEKSLAGALARVLREGGFDYEALKKFPMTIKKKEHSVYGSFYRDDIPVPKGPTKIVFQ